MMLNVSKNICQSVDVAQITRRFEVRACSRSGLVFVIGVGTGIRCEVNSKSYDAVTLCPSRASMNME